MDKYLIANILVWMAIIALGWQMHTKQRPCKLTLRGVVIFMAMLLFWGAISGLPPYLMNHAMVKPCAWRLYTAVPVVAVVWLILLLLTRWIKVTWVSLVILVVIVITTSLKYHWPFYYFPGVSGRVVDMDTGNGIKDAVVKAELEVCVYGSFGGPVWQPIRVISALTNSEGEYRIGRSLDYFWWPLTKVDAINLYGMHIVMATTKKGIEPPRVFPTQADIPLMSARKYFKAVHSPDWPRTITGWVEAGNPEEIVTIMRKHGISKEDILSYFPKLIEARKSVYGENDLYAKDLQPKEEWFR